MSSLEHRMQAALIKRREAGLLRVLKPASNLIDFCSNDYLGFARSKELQHRISNFKNTDQFRINGTTGSRLISGNNGFMESLEAEIAAFHGAEAGLMFNSGYDANLGLLSAIGRETETIFYDELIHASIHDGMRLSKAKHFSFRHNDLNHLESQLKEANGNLIVVVESVYSMDGDFAPLSELFLLCEKYGAKLIVDEAHAVGVFGEKGRGRVDECNLNGKVFAQVVTFGKALGCHGAIVIGNKLLRDYLINYSRSFIFTTAPAINDLIAVKCAYDMLSYIDFNSFITSDLIYLFKVKVQSLSGFRILDSQSPIQSVVIPGNDKVRRFSLSLEEAGFDVRPLVSPTVKKGTERVRICIHNFNSEAEIIGLIDAMKNVQV